MSFFPGSKSIRSKLPLLLLQRGALRKTIGNSLALTSISIASVCGDEVINSKPDPEIFLKAASLLKVPIAACIVAEDSINGLKAARAAGAISCMIPDLTPYTKELFPFCDYVSPSLLACKEILLQTPEADKLKSWK